MARIGYMRVSTDSQTTDLQEDCLKADGCERIFSDTMSGASTDRPGLDEALRFLRQGDVLVTWRLDRLGRSLPHLISLVTELEQRGVALRSLTEQIDTASPGGRLVFHVFGALAQFEREVIRQRVNAGLAAARQRGRVGGRPKVVTDSKAEAIKAMVRQGSSASDICKALGISRATFFRHRPQD